MKIRLANGSTGMCDLKLFGVGHYRTGTTTIAEMFAKHYRSSHEPRPAGTNAMIVRYLESQTTEREFCIPWVRRDVELNLEVEVNPPLGLVVHLLKEIHPQAKFILTVREPLSWLRSQLDYHFRVWSPAWGYMRSYEWWSEQGPWLSYELGLRDLGLCSLSVYLRAYSRHVSGVLTTVPRDRLLVVRTDRLNDSIPAIAKFAGVPEANLVGGQCNSLGVTPRVLSMLPADRVRARVLDCCGWMYSEFGFAAPEGAR